MAVERETCQAVLFGENLVMHCRIETSLGSQSIWIKDFVIDESSGELPHALLCHCNLGFPLPSPASRLIIDDDQITPGDEAALKGIEHFDSFEKPTSSYEEQVFFHSPKVDHKGFASAKLFNPDFNFGIQLEWLVNSMPIVTQWKMMGQGEYICGLEPATHAMGPRNKLAENSLPRSFSPNEHVEYELKLTVYENIYYMYYKYYIIYIKRASKFSG